MSEQTDTIDDAYDNDVMITEVTSAPKVQSVRYPPAPQTKPNVSNANHRRQPPAANAINVMTKMGLNTTNPRILQAVRLMQMTRAKRGPKEKATFQRFLYCLPDKTAKLPKFSSSDDFERAIVKQQQDEGYGYPPKDYNNGMPLRTHLNIGLSVAEFDSFLKATYPKLLNRQYDIYKIDKQRRLLRLQTLTPRAIKDMKYQGSLIIIPYDDPNDRPPAIMYRCISDSYALEYSRIAGTDEASSSLSDHQQMIETVTASAMNMVNKECTDHSKQPESTVVMRNEEEPKFVIKIETDSSDTEMETAVTSTKTINLQDNQQTTQIDQVHRPTAPVYNEADTSQTSCIKDFDGIFDRTEYLRSKLKDNVFYMHIDDTNLVQSLLQVYRQYLNVLEHKVVVCCINHQTNPDARHQQNPIQPYLVRFWDEIFELCFEGNSEKIPVCAPDIPEDIYIILGRIMYHGMVLQNYFPVRFSQACCSVIMTDGASEKQLAESFYNVISAEQKAIMSSAKAEIRSGKTEFEHETLVKLCIALRGYGNTTKPKPSTLNDCLTKLSKFTLFHRPYWCLWQMRCGLLTIRADLFQDIEERDVFMLYSALMPSALSLFDKIVYLFSTCEEDPELELEEKRVKSYLENFIMSLSVEKVRKLLLRWCLTDCLNSAHVYVRYSKSSICQRPVFDADVCTLTLSSVYTSQEEFSMIMSNEL